MKSLKWKALALLDVFAVHGYSDGIFAAETSGHRKTWEILEKNFGFSSETGKNQWMTETSGYSNDWLSTAPRIPAAMNVAIAVGSALKYGKITAWV